MTLVNTILELSMGKNPIGQVWNTDFHQLLQE